VNENASSLIQFIGRLHPLLVHLPIGFLILLATMEFLTLWPRFSQASAATGLIAWLAVPVTACSAACGWVLSRSGGYDEQILTWHKWLGLSLVPATIILALLRWRSLVKVYRACLAGTMVLLWLAGHYGGSLTHGKDYLIWFTKSAHNEGPTATDPDQIVIPELNDYSVKQIYSGAIEPIFKKYCINCHGPDKSKSKLRLDTVANVFKGGDSGPIIQPGDPSRSLLIKRLLLPEDEDEHMPPSGKRQPTDEEIALLRWWVTVGAPVNKTISELQMPHTK
jgi:uncharacterized membrane protein